LFVVVDLKIEISIHHFLSMPKAPPRRRSSRRLPCNGQCGKKDCTYVAERKSALKQHLSTDRHPCLVCKQTFSDQRGRDRHMRKQHPNEAITYLRCRPKLKCPSEFEGTHMNKGRWQFLKLMIKTNILIDQRKKKLRHKDRILLAKMNNNTTIHHMAAQIARRTLDDGLLEKNTTDTFGGFLPNGLIMRAHGGLFKLSIDRLHEKHSGGEYCLHYPDPDNAMANIRLVPLAINLGACGAFTLNMVQEAVGQPVDVASLLDYESVLGRKCITARKGKKNTTLYMCCNNIFTRDEKARDAFGSRNATWQWARAHLESIGGRCEISGIPLRTNQEKGSPFQMSIDAINPTLGHVPGNMRLVCRFLNPSCREKDKIFDDPKDGPSQWTPELFRQYFRIGKS